MHVVCMWGSVMRMVRVVVGSMGSRSDAGYLYVHACVHVCVHVACACWVCVCHH